MGKRETDAVRRAERPPSRRGAEVRALHPPTAAEPPTPAPAELGHAARLAAEVSRLEGELAALRAKMRELEAHADLDPLTGLFNRRGFERELTRAAAYVKRYGASAMVVYLDLDQFKPVNDRHGHRAGDALLCAIAETLRRNVRASDTVARLGGDEFAALLWNLSVADASRKAEALERAIAAIRLPWQGATLAVGGSAGVADLEGNDQPADAIARADAAMYARKRRQGAITR